MIDTQKSTEKKNQSISKKLEQEEKILGLLPLKNVVILPKTIIPVIVGRNISKKAVEHSLKNKKLLFITAQKDPNVEDPTVQDLYKYGTISTILQVMRMPNGSLKILVEGLTRGKILELQKENGFLTVKYEETTTQNLDKTVELEAAWRHLKNLYQIYAKLNEKAPEDLMDAAKTPQDIDYISDTLAAHIPLSFEERQSILETIDIQERIISLSKSLQKEIDILQTEKRIKGRVQTQVEKNQREYYLTEQMKAIQKELGREDQQTELAQLKTKLKNLGLPKEVYEKSEKEIRRLEQMPPLSSEAVVSRNYLDWIISLPWNKESKDNISLVQAEKILNKEHFGLQKVKERIIEFIASKKFSDKISRSPIICLVGPPGVGKTSLAKSIANSLGREFVRISLGGIRDEAEIRGHRRTYIGALPGKIIQSMKNAKTKNPVLLLDEIDKLSRDIHGDPASALLEVLDPEQNKAFVDHYLEVPYDLSRSMFITTANTIEGIPYPLFDRMEIITIAGYTEEEKLNIAKKFLIPKNLKEYNLKNTQFKISDEILKKVITEYTKEAGVRQLERVIAKLMRKTIQVLLKDKKTKKVTITEKLIKEWLGYPKFRKTSLDNGKDQVGIATGLAWTEYGGDVLEVETSIIPGKGILTLTGQLGDVMQESAQAALSYIRSRAETLGLPKNFTSNKDIHIHLPEGATPKDGPSAGIAMCIALISALTKIPIQPKLAMTGEITLRGRVLAIGGLKEKLLAARRYGIEKVILPSENKDDWEEIKKEIDQKMKIVFVNSMDEVVKQALTKEIKIKKKK